MSQEWQVVDDWIDWGLKFGKDIDRFKLGRWAWGQRPSTCLHGSRECGIFRPWQRQNQSRALSLSLADAGGHHSLQDFQLVVETCYFQRSHVPVTLNLRGSGHAHKWSCSPHDAWPRNRKSKSLLLSFHNKKPHRTSLYVCITMCQATLLPCSWQMFT